jgi:hypothetical protein
LFSPALASAGEEVDVIKRELLLLLLFAFAPKKPATDEVVGEV